MAPQALPIWLTDGSLVEWSDTIKLDASFPRARWPEIVAASLGPGIDEHYEGLVDPAIPIGGAPLEWREGGLDGQADWVALFDRPLANFEDLGAATDCTLQGMIQGQWIAPLADAKDVAWGPATLGNNLIARGRGIATTLGGIERAADGIDGASVRVNFPMACGGNRVHQACGADLSRLPIVELAHAVWRWAKAHPETPVRGIAFGATGEMSAYAAEPGRQRLHNAFLPRFFRRLMETCSQDLMGVVHGVRASAYRDVIDRGEFARPNAVLTLAVTDGRGWIVGEGAMMLTEKDSK